jgi:hypothetical protein
MPTLKNIDASTSERSANVKKTTELNGSALNVIKEPSEKRNKKGSEKDGESQDERPRKKRTRIDNDEEDDSRQCVVPEAAKVRFSSTFPTTIFNGLQKHKKHKKGHNNGEIGGVHSIHELNTTVVDANLRETREDGESSGARHKKSKKHKERLVQDSSKPKSLSTTTKFSGIRQAIIPVESSGSSAESTKKGKGNSHQEHPPIDPILLSYDSVEPNSIGVDPNSSSDEIWRAIRSMGNPALSKAVDRDIHGPSRTEKPEASSRSRASKRVAAPVVDESSDFATILSTKWLTTPILKQLSEHHGKFLHL